MYVTLYAADNTQIVPDTIKDIESAKVLSANLYVVEENQVTIAGGVMEGLPESIAKDLLNIIRYGHNFYPKSKEPDKGLPGCGALVGSMEPTPLHRDGTTKIVGMFQIETELGELNMSVPTMDYVTVTHWMIDHMYKSVKAYIGDPRPMSDKLGEEIEKELENLK